jgi:signal transduction histidine kinase
VRVAARLSGDALVVSVADEGEGIAPNAVRGASGLGLTMIATTADRMAVESLPGHGMRIEMRFQYT